MNVGRSRGFGVIRGEQGHEIFRLLQEGEKQIVTMVGGMR